MGTLHTFQEVLCFGLGSKPEGISGCHGFGTTTRRTCSASVIQHKGEVEAPGWAGFVLEPQLPLGEESGSEVESDESFQGRDPGQQDPPQPSAPSGPDGQHQLQETILYRHPDPSIQAQVRWTHIEDTLDDIADVLLMPRNHLVSVYEPNCPLDDVPQHVVPFIVHRRGDLPFGEPMKLCLLDIEIHENIHEINYATVLWLIGK